MKRFNCEIAYRLKIIRNEIYDKISRSVGKDIRDIIYSSVSRNLNPEIKVLIYWDVLSNGWKDNELFYFK